MVGSVGWLVTAPAAACEEAARSQITPEEIKFPSVPVPPPSEKPPSSSRAWHSSGSCHPAPHLGGAEPAAQGLSFVLQAVLQAAYLRAALQAAPARPPPPLPPAATVESVGQPWGRPPSSRRPPPPPTSTSLGSKGAMEGGGGEQEDDCCQSCRGLDKDEALRESKRLAQSGLPSFTSQLAERGWQVAPFMLSSTEKQYYIMMT